MGRIVETLHDPRSRKRRFIRNLGMICCVALVGTMTWKLCLSPAPTTFPALSKDWHEQVYSLDRDETARFIPPPFSPHRLNNLGMFVGVGPVLRQLAFAAPDRMWSPRMSQPAGTIATAMSSAGNKWVELDIPDQLYSVAVDGDWIVNVALPLERRNKALQSILRFATGKDLLIEQRVVEREVIVARGNWSFVPLAQQPPGQTIWLQFYTDKLDPTRAIYSPPANLTTILDWLEGTTNRKVIDEVTQRPTQNVPWMNHLSANEALDNEQKRLLLLENMSKQTSLKFIRTKRMIPVWFVRERSATTRPGNRR